MALDIAYFNYEHGGRQGADYHGDGGPYRYDGLVRVAGDGGRWPDVLIMGEGDRYEFNGGEGAWEAAAAMRDAGGPPYVPLIGYLPSSGSSMFAPVVFVDQRAAVIRRWYDHRSPDFDLRNANTLRVSMPGGTDWGRIINGHGNIHSGDMRLADARTFDRFGNPDIPCLIAMDWNSVPSGPTWQPRDYEDTEKYPPWRLAHRIHWHHGTRQNGPYEPDTRALDYLCGYWIPDDPCDPSGPGHRLGGIGFYDVAELEGDPTPTIIPRPNGRQPTTIDRILVNGAWKSAVVPGSYQVHQPADPDRPDSDHLRVSVTLDI